MPQYFETQFGDRIELDPRFERQMYPNSIRDIEYYRKWIRQSSTELGMESRIGTKIFINKISSDLQTLSPLLDLMEELNLLGPSRYRHGIDLAGNSGIHAAIFRGRYAEKMDVADIFDGNDPALTRRLLVAILKQWKFRLPDILFRISPAFQNWFQKKFPTKKIPRRDCFKHTNVPTYSRYYDFKFRRIPKVDRFFIGDWKDQVTGQYDLVLNFASLWLWDHREVMSRVSNMLETGGMFGFVAPYHWASRSFGDRTGTLGGQFAYFEQRLLPEDMQRYYEQFKPELAEFVEPSCEGFDQTRPTIQNYIDAALEQGLVLEGYKRLYNRNEFVLTSGDGENQKVVAERTAPHDNDTDTLFVDADEVLRDIHRFRPDVRLEDIMTRWAVMVFRKA